MEKPHKHKNLFLKFLPNAASAVNFQNPQFSPGRDHHHHHHSNTKLKSHAYKGFSGPINFAVLPEEALGKPKSQSYDSQEPTSPKVSCMGQIKYKHKIKRKLLKAATKKNTTTTSNHYDDNQHKQTVKSKEVKRSGSAISKFFSRSPKPADSRSKVSTRDNSNHAENNTKNNNMPSLGQMRKFASGRESLANFDWTAQIAPIDRDRDCYSDEERRIESDDEEDGEEREIIIPFSAPILVGGNGRVGLEPRKEVNLWKRRTMDPPPPHSLHSKVR